MAKKKKPESEKPIAFESSFEELQQIVNQLENGQLSLGDSLASYETGIKRLRECYQALDQAEKKIKQLVDLDEDGNLITTDFKSDTASAAKRKAADGKAAKNKSGRSKTDSNAADESEDDSLF